MTLWRDSLIQPVSQRRKKEGEEKNVNTRKEGRRWEKSEEKRCSNREGGNEGRTVVP